MEKLTFNGVTYKPGITMNDLRRNELESELYGVLRDIVVHMHQGKRLSNTAIAKKARVIYHEVISNHLYVGAVQ